jgi:hypothetical protein
MVPIDPTSNYRKYYARDIQFHLLVIDKEEAPYDFKVQVFRNEEAGEFNEQDEAEYDSMVANYGAENIKIQMAEGSKMMVKFTVSDKAKASECYLFFSKSKFINQIDRVVIYLNKGEEVFMKYGDEEAKRYEDDQERRKLEK